MQSIAILLACHNRKDKTIDCLNILYENKVPLGFSFDVFIVDDGSTDGTTEAINKNFSEITIIKGNGNLFWNQGMRLAWSTAAQTKEFDFYLWLNDDTMLNKSALETLVLTSNQMNDKAIIVGATHALNNTQEVTYGGRSLKSGLLTPQSTAIPCDYFNGNIVWIPKEIYKTVGINDAAFHHALGDFDYGLRASKLGVKSYIAPGFLGECDVHESLPAWCNPKKNLNQRWKAFRSPLGNNPEEFFVFEKRHKGIMKAVKHYFTNHLRVFIPSLWKNN